MEESMDIAAGTKFRELSLTDKLDLIKKNASLEDRDVQFLKDSAQSLGFDNVNRMIENAIGVFPVPMGIATNFVINDMNYFIPMAIEEPSVIAATSKAAKIARLAGGFHAQADDSLMIGQIQVIPNGKSYEVISAEILKNTDEFYRIASTKTKSSRLENIEVRTVQDESQLGMGDMIIVELTVNTHDAMGANVVNAMCEAVGQSIESLTGCMTILKILSNYSVRRLVRCRATFPKNHVGGDITVERILYAYAFAYSDVYRAVTHNKGIMNGIDAVALATGQDFRAIEAAAHAYASREGRYRSLSRWWRDENGDLVGELEMPMAVGIVGGVTKVHQMAATSLRILKVSSSQELAIVIASVGLAQNFAALLALASEGIQKGHMRLHSRNIAYMAGARGDMIDIVSERLVEEDRVNLSRAKELFFKFSQDGHNDD